MWNKKFVKSVIRISKLCNRQRELHSDSFNYYHRLYKVFMYGSLILAPLSTGTSGIGLLDTNQSSIFNIISTISSALSFVSLSILKNGSYEQVAQAHQMAIAKYTVLINNIITQLSLPIDERGEPKKYIKWITETYNAILESAPFVRNGLEGEFDSAYLLEIEEATITPPLQVNSVKFEEDCVSRESDNTNETNETVSSIELQIKHKTDNPKFDMKQFYSRTQSHHHLDI